MPDDTELPPAGVGDKDKNKDVTSVTSTIIQWLKESLFAKIMLTILVLYYVFAVIAPVFGNFKTNWVGFFPTVTYTRIDIGSSSASAVPPASATQSISITPATPDTAKCLGPIDERPATCFGIDK